MNMLSRRSSRGQGLVEYALIIALVAVVVIAALVLLGPAISSIFVHINSALYSAVDGLLRDAGRPVFLRRLG